MLSQPFSVSFDIGGNRIVTIETGKLARQADGAVTVRQVTVCYLQLLLPIKIRRKDKISSH